MNISSLSALGNAANSAVYSASKAAVNAITKVLALELAKRKIRVNGIMPIDVELSEAFDDLIGIPEHPLKKRK